MASWARAAIQFRLLYAIEGHTVWKQTAIYFQPLLIMKAEGETEAGSSVTQPPVSQGILSLCCSPCLIELMVTWLVGV